SGVEGVGRAGRGGPALVVVEENVVLLDEGKFGGGEVELRRIDGGALGFRPGEVAVDRPWPLIVARRQLDAFDLGVGVVERGQDDRRAELALIDQVLGDLVVSVEAQRQALDGLELEPRVEVVRAFGPRWIIGRDLGRRRRAGRRSEGCTVELAERWRREVAGVAGMRG